MVFSLVRGECKILLVEFFKLIREDSSELGIQRRAQEDEARLKTEARLTARSTGRAQTCTLGKTYCSGRPPRVSNAAKDNRSTVQNVIFSSAQLAIDRPERRLEPA